MLDTILDAVAVLSPLAIAIMSVAVGIKTCQKSSRSIPQKMVVGNYGLGGYL